jgi:predicted nuclease with TOPRIM domain
MQTQAEIRQCIEQSLPATVRPEQDALLKQVQALQQELSEVREELKKEQHKNKLIQKRLMFLGTHCDALSRMLEAS